MRSNPYLFDYTFALYDNLLKFRNEIIHNDNFSINGDKLIVDIGFGGSASHLEMSRAELGCLVRSTLTVARILSGKVTLNAYLDTSLKYHFGMIAKCHLLGIFGVKQPRLVNVVLNTPEESGNFPVYLSYVRDELNKIYQQSGIFFNLEIVGIINGESCFWRFPHDKIPSGNALSLKDGRF